ncbi:MAG: hypothetical protein QXV73_04270 [Candidatus Micrarchaeia archaeon]
MRDVRNEDIKTELQSKQGQVENELSSIPSRIKVSVPDVFSVNELNKCQIDRDVDVEFMESNLSFILSVLKDELDLNFLYDISEEQRQSIVQANQSGVENKDNEKQSSQSVNTFLNRSGGALTIKYKGKLCDLFNLLSHKTGYFFDYRGDSTVIVEKEKTFSFIVPNYFELLKYVKDSIEKLGARNVSYDNFTSMLNFTVDYTGYERVKRFLQSLYRNASLINLRIVLLSVSFDSENNIGIDWSRFTLDASDRLMRVKSDLNLVTNNQGASIVINRPKFSFSGFLNFIEKYGKYSILQNVYMQTLSGVKGRIEVVKETPYIKEVSLSTSNTTTGTALGTATSDKAKSGVELEMVPYYDKLSDTLSINLKVVVSEVIRLINLNAGQQIGTLTQPEVSLKTVNTQLRLTPEQVIILGGLIYEKGYTNTSGLPFDSVLTKEMVQSKSKEELVILVKPTIIEFVPSSKEQLNN